MKLAEALILRADMKRRLDQLKQRLLRNAKVQEGETPAEDPEALLKEVETLTGEMVALIQKINTTNSRVEMKKGLTIAEAIAARDMLLVKQGIYRDLAQAATVTPDIRTKSEIKFKSTVKVAAIQEAADHLAKAHRELDTQLQEINWLTDLIE